MALFTRRESPPSELLAVLPKDERVISWADVEGGAVVAATSRGLWWPDPDGPRLIGWQYINKATWHDGVLTVIEADVVDDVLLVDRPRIEAVLTKPRDLPPTVRKRIEANVVRSDVMAVTGGTARFVARRIPGQDGMTWWARLEPGTPDTDAVRSAISARLALLRAEWDEQRRWM
jgi:hypothetical protein